MTGKHGGARSPNDQRSDAKNSNNADCKASVDNRSNQMNANSEAFRESRRRK